MSILRIFNPEHDLALAFGGTNYTPPPMARLLKRDLQLLPAWIGGSGDSVLSQDVDLDVKWLKDLNDRYDLGVDVVSVGQIENFNEIQPWGWNKFLQRRLFLDGAKAEALKSDLDIENNNFNISDRVTVDPETGEFLEIEI